MTNRILAILTVLWLVVVLAICNTRDEPRYTHINEAIRAGDSLAVDEMISDGVDVNAREAEWDVAPLLQAVVLDDVKTSEKLLDSGARIEDPVSTSDGLGRIIERAKDGDESALAWLRLHQGVETVDDFVKGPYADAHEKTFQATALWSAASRGQTEMVKMLLRHGANTEARATFGSTSLHVAAFYGHDDVVKLLVDASADLEAFNDGEMPPLAAAALGDHVKCAEILLAAGADPFNHGSTMPSAVHAAASEGATRTLLLFIEHDVPIDQPGFRGVTPLHRAAVDGHVAAVKLLLEHGAAIDARADGDATPLIFAANDNRLDVIKTLVEAGADTTARAKNGQTARDRAMERGHTAIVEYFDSLE